MTNVLSSCAIRAALSSRPGSLVKAKKQPLN